MHAVTTALVLGAIMFAGPAAGAPAGSPELSRCPALSPLAEPLNDRTRPLPVPASYAMIMASGRDRFAVSTIYGGTVCIDSRPMTKVRNFTISEDRRFFEFDWTGYEADGHIVVDRTGKGQVIDTGVSPVSSPTASRFAAIQQSEAAFGALEGFGVWQVAVVGIRRLTLQQDIPALADWRIDRWVGDDCIELSGIPYGRMTDPGIAPAKLRRDRYVAAAGGSGWLVTPTASGCPPVKKRK